MICPGCKLEIDDKAQSCSCGWRRGAALSGAPTINDLKIELVDIMIELKNKGDIDAAERFLQLLEPESRRDRPVKISVLGKKDGGYRWAWDYSVHVKDCLRIFLTIPTTDQETIKAAREDNIFWRGDDVDQFMLIIDETMRMRDIGVEQYRVECLRNMGRLRMGAA